MADQPSTPKTIAFNLDEYTRKDKPDTLWVTIGGEAVKFNDPVELDYRLLDRIETPDAFAKYCVADESRQHFKDQTLSVGEFRRLTEVYMEHYRVDELLGN